MKKFGYSPDTVILKIYIKEMILNKTSIDKIIHCSFSKR